MLLDLFIDGIQIATVCVFIVSVCSYFGTIHPLLEVTAHFKFQNFYSSLFVSLIFLARQDWEWLIFGFITLMINGAEVIPWYLHPRNNSKPENTASFRIFLSNVLLTNRHYDGLIGLIHEKNPDIVVLQEVNRRWLNALEPIKARFPFVLSFPNLDDFDIAIFSRFPLSKAEIKFLGDGRAPYLQTSLQLHTHQITLLSTHLTSPGLRNHSQARNMQLVEIANLSKTLPKPMIVIGDLNISMWSPFYRKFIKNTGFMNARKGSGILATWPNVFQFLMIPLDHCLISKEFKVEGMTTEKVMGSDHFSLVVDLSLDT
ncbi:MAG: endonuclease/exonuclease/phosphatase family protein [Waddliaceae bacterium]